METREDRLITSLESFVSNDIEQLKENIQKLIKDYERKSKRLDKIMKQSDKQQMEVLHLNEQLDEYKNHLEEKVEEQVGHIRRLNDEIVDTQKEVVFTMGAIGESRSKETGNHVKRVAEYSRVFAVALGMGEEEADLVKQASPMHDIGKVGIPDAVLNKPGKLDEEEYRIMKTHAELGYNMLKHSERPILKAAATIAYEHHEKWNGRGYPQGLAGEDIHIYGRISALADVFDALGSDRCYKKAWDDERIFQLFKEERAEHFDPQLVDIFFKHLDAFLAIRETYRDTESSGH